MPSQRNVAVIVVVSVVLVFPTRGGSEEADSRRAELVRLLRIFPKSPEWEAWLQKTGELPPDFERMPSIPWLPDPLALEVDGKAVPVRTAEDWARKRKEILEQFHRYVIGSVPPPPGNVRARSVRERHEQRARALDVELEFGPERRATLSLELLVPDGDGPFPVFLTQHTHRAWALQALSRGYAACVYAGADSKDDTAKFIDVWPEHDWTKLARRAFAASRAIDYLETLTFIDRTKIGMTGHSRNGKMSLMAAAMDERIAAVISSSSGAGGACPYRLFSEAQFGEGIELITRVFPDWLHPRLRFFAGREQKLPIDNHELIALAAPRACLISTALNDPVESAWAIQEAYVSAKRVYDLLGHPERIAVLWRAGTHGTRVETIETYLDWLDGQFGRCKVTIPERLIYPASDLFRSSTEDAARGRVENLLEKSGGGDVKSAEEWRAKVGELRRKIQAALAPAEPPSANNPGGDYGTEERYLAMLLMRPEGAKGIAKKSINFGNYIAGDLYVPEGAEAAGAKLPCVVWLHPCSCSNGYVAGYKRGEPVHIALAREGFVVFAYDQIGFGSRIEEITRFQERYRDWSLLGKMVADARAAVDSLREQPLVDPSHIFILGYGLGGSVGLHAACLDERIAGVVSIAGFPQLRLRDLVASMAPRPCLVVAPTIGREAELAEEAACVSAAQKVYALFGAAQKLQLWAPDDYDRYPPEMQAEVNRRLKAMAAK